MARQKALAETRVGRYEEGVFAHRSTFFRLRWGLLLISLALPVVATPLPCRTGVVAEGEAHDPWAELASWRAEDAVLVVVDGVSDGARYAKECRRLFPSVKTVHLQSSPALPPGLARSFQANDYDARFVYDRGEHGRLLRLLRRFDRRRVRVVAGTETGVALSDRVGSELETLSNGTDLSAARRDKFLMEQRLRPWLVGPGAAETLGSQSLHSRADLERAVAQSSFRFPVALKPAGSAGNFGFTVAQNRDELEEAFDGVFDKPDPLGIRVSCMLLQPYVPGDVVAVNLTSHPYHGAYVNDLWRTKVERRGKQIVFRRTSIFRFDRSDPLHRRLVRAAMAVRNALDVTFGPLHPEFLVTPDGRIFFIDSGARPAGGTLTAVARHCGAVDQIQATLLAAFAPRRFRELVRKGPVLEREAALVYLASSARGKVRSVPSNDEIRARVPGFRYADLSHYAVGQTLGVSGSLFDQPGFFLVEGNEPAQVESERAVRGWESNGFYQLDPVD